MIKDKNQKGFALVLSLVLMLAMSLMGGALIVILKLIKGIQQKKCLHLKTKQVFLTEQ